MADAAPQPPPLDPTLILRARAALLAAGLPGDDIEDEAVAGLVAAIGRIYAGLSLYGQWSLLDRWVEEWQARQAAQSP